MRKTVKKIIAVLCAFSCAVFVTACAQDGKGNVNTTVSVAASADKFLQSYDVSSSSGKKVKELFDTKLKDEMEINAYRNEYESKQLIIYAEETVESYTVEFSDLISGDNHKIGKENIAIYQEYYHYVETLYDSESTMTTGMFPDALIPFADAVRLGMNKIEKGKNQGVYCTVYVPKTAASGIYTGTATVTLNGKTVKNIAVKLRVFDYTLSDSVSLMSCIPLQIGFLFNGELNNTEEMYRKYVDRLNEYRLAVNYLNPYMFGLSDDTQGNAYILDREIELATQAAKDVSVSGYAIRVYAAADDIGNVLDEQIFSQYLRAYVDGSIENNVNLFAKAYVYMGNIIDEPNLGGASGIARANYVCGQFDKIVADTVAYAETRNASPEVIESLSKLRHVVTGAYENGLTGPQSYCPTIDVLSNTAEVDRYRSLREEGKSYWWYTCTQPKIPYPTVHLDDNGVSARAMSWMAKEYDVDGYLTWESAFYASNAVSGQTEGVTTPVYGMDLYNNVHRWGDAYGDGWFFYPGAPLGIDGPVDSMRLPIIRDGMEEYEALCDLEKKYEELSETYGVHLDVSGVLNELYASLYSNVKVYCSADELDAAHKTLGELLEAAENGIAISDFTVNRDGKISAQIYFPQDKNILLNGTELETVAVVSGKKAVVNGEYSSFVVSCGDLSVSLHVPQIVKAYSVTTESVQVFDLQQELLDIAAESVTIDGIDCVKAQSYTNVSRLTVNVSNMEQTYRNGSITVYVYSNKELDVSLSVQGAARNRLLDTFTLREGWNVLRVDRLQDFDLSTLGNIRYVHLSFEANSAESIAVSDVILSK